MTPQATALARTLLLAAVAFGVSAPGVAVERFDPRKVNVTDLDVVDCILPGQIRSLGHMTYQTPRRLIRTQRGECAIKGGEAKIYDRTDTKSALDAWLPAAEQNDVDAQNRVALIYEGAYGGTPNFERAVAWYRRAAEAGYKPAQYSLGVMLEQGRGVEKNVLEALEWYRKASGIENDSLRLSSETQRELAGVRKELQDKLDEAQSQIDVLEGQMSTLKQQAAAKDAKAAAAQRQLQTLTTLVASLKKEQATKKVQLAAIPAFRTPVAVDAPRIQGQQLPIGQHGSGKQGSGAQQPLQLGGADLGKYYALVIGDQDYQHLEALTTPVNDAKKVADVLEQKYGFQVMLVLNANATTIKQAINELDKRATAKDNVLIYFAGHGVIRNLPGQTAKTGASAKPNVQGFWLPVEAEQDKDTFWIDNMWVTEHLALNSAKRVLVVADSCYAGLFSSDPSVLLSNNAQYTQEELNQLISLRARYVLSSGDIKPVLDRGAGDHSVFARAFLDVLAENRGVLSSVGLYRDVFEKVAAAARKLGIEQLPQLRPIRPAGHEWGDFFFVPRA